MAEENKTIHKTRILKILGINQRLTVNPERWVANDMSTLIEQLLLRERFWVVVQEREPKQDQEGSWFEVIDLRVQRTGG